MSESRSVVKVSLVSSNGQIFGHIELRRNTILWVGLRKHGIPIGASCSGVGVCAACDFEVLDGELALSVKTGFEAESLKRNDKPLSSRLACLCRVQGDLTITAGYW